MYKALKFRIYPTKKQEKQIINNFEASRFIYNYYLEKAKTEKTNNFINCIIESHKYFKVKKS